MTPVRKLSESSIVRNNIKYLSWTVKTLLAIVGGVALFIASVAVGHQTQQGIKIETIHEEVGDNTERIVRLETQWGHVKLALERIEDKLP